jgi:hypothetical protein
MTLCSSLRREPIEHSPPGRPAASTRGNAVGHSKEPAPNRFLVSDEPGSVREDQKGRLECIFRIMRILKRRPADAENHRPMPDHQLFKCRLGTIIFLRDKPVQKLGIGDRSHRAKLEYAVYLPKHLVRCILRSLRSQGVDRIEHRSPMGRVNAENNPDRDRD